MGNLKKCTVCGNEKELSSFGKDKAGKFGVKSKCKVCWKSYMTEYNKTHQDIIKKYYVNNKEKINQKAKEDYYKDPAKHNQRVKEYQEKNREKVNGNIEKWIYDNKDHVREYFNNYQNSRRKVDPSYKLRLSISSRINDLLKQKGTYKTNSTLELLCCTLNEFKEYLESKFKPEMNWQNHGKIWEIDHIIPCSSFDLTKLEEQKKYFHYTNHQPLFRTTKIAKSYGYINEIGNRNKSNKV